MIAVDSVSRSFPSGLLGRRRVTPLKDVTHVFPDGAVTYLAGLNGTGKSTLLRLMCGVLRADAGVVEVTGPHGGATGMMLSAAAALPAHSGRRHLRWAAEALGLPRPGAAADRALAEAGLGGVGGSAVGGWSLGMRQRLGIACALLGEPGNVVLDEPLNGLDVAGVLWLRGLLRVLAADGRCVVVASHHLAEVEASGDHVVVLEDGRVAAAGTVAEVRGGHASLERACTASPPRAASHEVRR